MAAQGQEGDKGQLNVERRDFGEEPLRQGFETWISFIVEHSGVGSAADASCESRLEYASCWYFKWLHDCVFDAMGPDSYTRTTSCDVTVLLQA